MPVEVEMDLKTVKEKQVSFLGIFGLGILMLVGTSRFALATHSCAPSGHIDSQRAADVSWDENTEVDLAGYRLHYGKRSGRYETTIDVGNQTTCVVSGLDPKVDYYFAVTAYDVDEEESLFSNEGFSGGDRTAPIISDIRVTEITSSSAIISWATDEPTRGELDYGTTAAFDLRVYSPTETKTHQVTLSNLDASTTYFYRFSLTDSAGNIGVLSGTYPHTGLYFTTAPAPTPSPAPSPNPTPAPAPEQAPLTISRMRVLPVGRSRDRALIRWRTNRPATSRVEYGETASYGKVSEQKAPLVTRHFRAIGGLRPERVFYFRVVSEDSDGSVAVSTGKFKISLSRGKPVIRR